MNIGQLISGIFFLVAGIVLIILAFFTGIQIPTFMMIIYGVIALVLGIILLLNNKEDVIEKIKRR